MQAGQILGSSDAIEDLGSFLLSGIFVFVCLCLSEEPWKQEGRY